MIAIDKNIVKLNVQFSKPNVFIFYP